MFSVVSKKINIIYFTLILERKYYDLFRLGLSKNQKIERL
jgi:hypothetical protein